MMMRCLPEYVDPRVVAQGEGREGKHINLQKYVKELNKILVKHFRQSLTQDIEQMKDFC